MPGVVDFIREQRTKLPLVPTPADVAGRTFIVTGANSGLGYEAVKHLFELGAGRVILAARSLERLEKALAALREETGKAGAGEVWQLDVASLASVEAFAKRVATLDRVDVFIAAAGAAIIEYHELEGLESGLTINVVGTLLLVTRVLPKLRETAQKFAGTPHMVVVTSETAFMETPWPVGGVKSNVFTTLSNPKTSDMKKRYPLSKLLQIWSVRELCALLPFSETGVVINLVHPGLCKTNLSTHGPWGLFRVGVEVMKLVAARTSEQGSRTLLHGAVAGPESHGKYLGMCVIKGDDSPWVPEWLYDAEGAAIQKRVWRDLNETLAAKGHAIDIGK